VADVQAFMQLGGVFTDETAVSTVVSVVLMVAVTVTLAAVIGAFVFGFDEPQETAPQVEFEFEKIDQPSGHDEVVVTHANGESVQNTNLYVTSDEGVRDADGSPSSDTRFSWYRLAEDDGAEQGAALRVDDSLRFETQASDIENVEVRLIWQPSPDAPSAIIARWITSG
jgi:FlaG/FlaF family flagellin (archaellin)